MKKIHLLAVLIVLLILLQFSFSQEIFEDSVNIKFLNICSDWFCEPIVGNDFSYEANPFENPEIYGSFTNNSTGDSNFTINIGENEVFSQIVKGKEKIEFNFPIKNSSTIIAMAISEEIIAQKTIHINIASVEKHSLPEFQTLLLLSLAFFILAAGIGIAIRNKFGGREREDYKYKTRLKIAGSVFAAFFIVFIWLYTASRIPPEILISAVLFNFGFMIILFSFFYFISQKMIEQSKNSAFLTVGIIAAAISFFVNTSISMVLLGGNAYGYLGSAIGIAPVVEELSKGLLLILLLVLFKINSPRKGFFFGTIVGMGFAVVENVFYSVITFSFTTSVVAEQLSIILLRIVLPAHMFFTGLTGLLFLLFNNRINNKLVSIFASLGLGITLHATFNLFANTPFIGLILIFILVALLIAGLYIFSRVDLNSIKL